MSFPPHAEDYFDHAAALRRHHGLNQDGSLVDIVVVHNDDAAFWTGEGYEATFGDYDLDAKVGRGRTPLDAIVDLLDQMGG